MKNTTKKVWAKPEVLDLKVKRITTVAANKTPARAETTGANKSYDTGS